MCCMALLGNDQMCCGLWQPATPRFPCSLPNCWLCHIHCSRMRIRRHISCVHLLPAGHHRGLWWHLLCRSHCVCRLLVGSAVHLLAAVPSVLRPLVQPLALALALPPTTTCSQLAATQQPGLGVAELCAERNPDNPPPPQPRILKPGPCSAASSAALPR